jgi:hypothetical protein
MRLVMPQIGPRPHYEATIPIPWRLWNERAGSPCFGDETWWHECGRKKAFFCKRTAQLRAWVLSQHSNIKRKGQSFVAYECRWCEWFHLGHQPIRREN